ncbi:Tektin-1 [Liparis tanakae]|uniref:Tektin n=1 Tax=Liparis tanakae TaxID=230148 RepID=A0A4Z2E2V9_9TELE|nr:Tektin-1 [Liparis tanakae]
MSVPDCSTQQGDGSNLENMEFKRHHSELLRAACVKLIEDTGAVCKRMQSDDSKGLGQRVRDIQFLKKELEMKLGETIVEMDLLLASQSREARALEACQEPLRITAVCLEERSVPAVAERNRKMFYTLLLFSCSYEFCIHRSTPEIPDVWPTK